MSVELFPQQSAYVAQSEAGCACKDSGCDDDPEEIPQTAHERAACELIGQQAPGEGRCANESGEEPYIGGKVLYGRAAELVELGENRLPRRCLLMLNLAAFRHLACSM